MTDEATAIPADDTPLTLDEAASAYAERRSKESEQPAESAEPATAEQSEAKAEDAAPPQEATGETQEDAPAEQPPRELPRSWTKDRAEHWNKLDPDTQEFLLDQDRKASAEVRRSQNEAAEVKKAVEAKLAEVEKVRQQYETKLPSLLNELESVNQAQFGDVKTMEDVVKLQAEDPFRFQAWQVHQMRLQAVKAESDRAEHLKLTERQSKRASYEAEQNKLLLDLVPDMADPKKSVELRERAVTMLTDDLGMKRDQLERWMADDTGHEILSNAGFQKLVADGLKYRDLLKAPKAVVKPNLPPVQRPGARQPAGAASDAAIQALRTKLTDTGSIDDAFALYRARKSAKA